MKKKNEVMSLLKNGLVVSCQVKKDDPQYMDGCVQALVKAAIWAEADGLRINEPDNIRDAKKITDIPVIGLWKKHSDDSEVFMTPTMDDVSACVDAGAEIVAIDGTPRMIHGHEAWDIIPQMKEKYPDILIFADVRDEIDAEGAIKRGADIVAPTFYRFSPHAKSTDLPDWEMVNRLIQTADKKAYVFMEGKIWTPDDAIRALYYGCYAVVVGSAITRPHLVARRFHDHMTGFQEKRSLYY